MEIPILIKMTHHLSTKALILICMLILFLSGGCSSNKIQEQPLMDLHKEINSLHKYNMDTNRRVKDLNNALSRVEKSVEHNSVAMQELKQMIVSMEVRKEENGRVKEKPVESGEVNPPPEAIEETPIAETRKEAVREEKITPLLSPGDIYRDAFESFRSEDYDLAITKFRRFVKEFPEHKYADNALYWIGEILYSQKKFPQAIIEFSKITEEYKSSNKAPDALLKIGLTYINLRDFRKAEDRFQMLMDMYPFSDAAKKAAARLREMDKQ